MNHDRLIYCAKHGGWRHALDGKCSRCVHDRLAAELMPTRNRLLARPGVSEANRKRAAERAARCRTAKAMYPTYNLQQLADVVGLSHETVRKALKGTT